MKNAVEVLNITETRDGAVTLVNDLGLSDANTETLLRAMFVLAFNKITEDVNRAEGLVPINPGKDYENVITATQFLLVDGEFEMTITFGRQIDPRITLKNALLHVSEVVAKVQETIV